MSLICVINQVVQHKFLDRAASHLLISLSGHLEEVLARLNRYEDVAFEVLDQTLEDTFMEYAR